MKKFHVKIRESVNNEFYAVLVSRNGKDVFVGETRKRKSKIVKMCKDWFPGITVK